ncbi:2-aminoethanethiol dioxygenase [Copidosoma floridanum]|uniref:2-aminoethanethiol dioxygenase n=1 Tax=Copidosoma floridanum TaxID=29053 RepID=UPI0006C98798|nr:2-aminoethanethiol dioxygenase [Copidosoma floridanum]
MASKIELLWKQALKCFTGCQIPGYVFSSKNFEKLTNLMNEITAEDVSVNKNMLDFVKAQPAPMCAIDVFENQDITIAVFILKSGMTLPMHNHPEMHGLLKVINGVVKINSYTFETQDDEKTLELGRTISVTKHAPVTVRSTDPACVLTPILKNIHEITCLEGPAAFLDVLSPPYDILGKYGEKSRLCTYFKVLQDDGTTDKVQLEVTNVPLDFYSHSIMYLGKPLS